MMRRAHQDQQSGVLYELSSLVLNILRSPPSPIQFSDQSLPVPAPPLPPPSSSLSRRSPHQISPAGFASLLLGISLALMLCGSVTFFIGFILMPWVLGLVMVFYVVGIVSSLSMLGRSILCYATAPSNPQKEIPAWKVLWIRGLGGGWDRERRSSTKCCCDWFDASRNIWQTTEVIGSSSKYFPAGELYITVLSNYTDMWIWLLLLKVEIAKSMKVSDYHHQPFLPLLKFFFCFFCFFPSRYVFFSL